MMKKRIIKRIKRIPDDLDFDAGKRIYKKATPHQPVFVLKNI